MQETTERWKRSPGAVLIALLAIHVLAHIDRNMLLATDVLVIASALCFAVAARGPRAADVQATVFAH